MAGRLRRTPAAAVAAPTTTRPTQVISWRPAGKEPGMSGVDIDSVADELLAACRSGKTSRR